MNILIIEDEKTLADVIRVSLENNNYQVEIEGNGKEGYYKALSDTYDLIILDVMLPDMDGFTILKKLREEKINTKIIMLTAKSTLDDKLEGLENGANDYITKPFHIEELIARVNIQLKGSSSKTNKDILSYKDIELNLKTSYLSCINNNNKVLLVNKELLLLEYLIVNKDLILSKDQIYNKIWGLDSKIESNNLEVYLSFIRKKLKAIDSKVNIKSLRNMGYKLEYKDE